MKIRKTYIRKFAVLLTGAALSMATACSSSQQDEEDLEMSNEENSNQQGNLGADDAAEGNGQENAVENAEGAQGENEQGAEVNSDTNEEFAGEEGAEGEQTAEENPTLDDSAGNAAPVNNAAATPVNTAAPANATAAMDPAAAMGAPAAPAQAPAASEKSPVPGGRVRYVREGGVQVVNAPGGSPVFSLEQGDHPVTWEENGWLRLSTGMYVPVDALSDKGVARAKGGTGWSK